MRDSSKLESIPDEDLYYFNVGEHKRIHRFFGANHLEIGVLLAVWAPKALAVAVVGSFNNWDIHAHAMQKRNTTGVWERFIPGLGHGIFYKFAIRKPDGKWYFKTDPFARFIQNERDRTPILIEDYYEFKSPRMKDEDKFSRPLSIFEVHPLSWRYKGGRPLSYLELIDALVPYVKYMEYTHVELMGIMEHPYVPSWGYQVIGFYAPTSRMGTPVEFKQLIDAFHREGIGVIIDTVLVHFPKDDTGLARYDSDCLFESPIPERKVTAWDTYYFDFARNEVKSFLISNLFYWIEEYFIDGFRFDAGGHFHYYEFKSEEKHREFLQRYGNCHNPEGFRFMQTMNYTVKKEHPEVLLIVEDPTIASGVTKPVEYGGHGFDYKWDLGCTSHMMKYFRAPYEMRSEKYENLTYPMLYHHTENFLLPLCHDEVVHMKRTMVNKTEDLSVFEKFANLRVMYLFQYGMPHKKLLFMGQEFGQMNEWLEETQLPWESLWDHNHKSMQWYVKRLNEVYKYVSAMHEGDNIKNGFEWIECQNHRHNIIAFIRYNKDYTQLMVYLLNFSKEYFGEFRVGVPFRGKYCKVIDTQAQEFGGNGHNWIEEYYSEDISAYHHQFSLRTKLLPLHGLLFKSLELER